MTYSFKVYISDGKEFFEYGIGQETTRKSFAFSQSLMDLLYLDIWSYGDVFDKMGTAVRKLYETKDDRWADEIKKGLDTLAEQHIYFECLRLNWRDKLNKEKEQEFQGIVDLLPYKKLTHIPSNIHTLQDQIKTLWNRVLDILSRDEPIQKKMVDYYNQKGGDSLNMFQFQPQPMSFEIIDQKTFTEVLYPKDIYDIIDFFVRECIKQEQQFRVCKNCGKYFALTGHINTEYCDRPFDNAGRTCKEMGALRLWEKKKAENPALKAYSKAYKKRFAWIKYGKTTKEAFYEWAEKARKNRELCLKGDITLDDFQEWLDD
ncbi:MAG: DUF6076 domain-containing protein [Clostridia bacterium]|nr:DUF6076 domain-containing protein [Clostridia bacterium]